MIFYTVTRSVIYRWYDWVPGTLPKKA